MPPSPTFLKKKTGISILVVKRKNNVAMTGHNFIGQKRGYKASEEAS